MPGPIIVVPEPHAKAVEMEQIFWITDETGTTLPIVQSVVLSARESWAQGPNCGITTKAPNVR